MTQQTQTPQDTDAYTGEPEMATDEFDASVLDGMGE